MSKPVSITRSTPPLPSAHPGPHQPQAVTLHTSAILPAEVNAARSTAEKALGKTILHQVSFFLTPTELGRSIRVCRSWKVANTENRIWNWQLQRWGSHPEVVAALRQANMKPSGRISPDACRLNDKIARIISGYLNEVVPAAMQAFARPYPLLAYGREEWRECLGDPGEDVPPLPGNIYEILQSPCPFFGVPMEECYLLALVPATVACRAGILNLEPDISQVSALPWAVPVRRHRSPLTLHLLHNLVLISPRGTQIAFNGLGAAEAIMTRPNEQSHWELLSKQLLPGSAESDYPRPANSLEAHGFQVPNLLGAASMIFLHRLLSKEALFPPPQYTFCQEMDGDKHLYTGKEQLIIGGFTAFVNGLNVDPLFMMTLRGCLIGTAAMKKL